MSCDPTWYVRLFYYIGVVATYVGIVLLLLSYFGTKLVLEIILGRSWQA